MDLLISEVEILRALRSQDRLPLLEESLDHGGQAAKGPARPEAKEDFLQRLPETLRAAWAQLSPEEQAWIGSLGELTVGRYLSMTPDERELFRQIHVYE